MLDLGRKEPASSHPFKTMGNAFGEKKTMKEIIREQKRMVDRAARALERDRMNLQKEEKKLIADIKKNAKENKIGPVKIMAKDLVRIRKHEEKFTNLTAQLRAISLQMTAMASTQAISESMKKVTSAMIKLNKQVNLPQLQQVMREFAKQSEQMDMKQEMIGDSIDDVMDDGEDEKERDEIVNQVLDEIGVSLGEGLVDVPGKRQQEVPAEEHKVDEADRALEARFNNLGGQ